MRRHRFISDWDLTKPGITINDVGLLDQWRKVLKLDIGEELILGDGRGEEAVAKILILDKTGATLEIISRQAGRGISKRPTTLYLSILKRDNFELAVQKAVECGVDKIVPITTERTIKLGLNTERLEKIIKEAAEQSGRAYLPTLAPATDFTRALEEAKETGRVIIFDSAGEKFSGLAGSSDSVSIFIGPEGGFAKMEVELAKTAGAEAVSLGPLTLRAETAAIVASYLASSFY